MQEVATQLSVINLAALDTVLKATLGSKCLGISSYGPQRPISVWLSDDSTPDNHVQALGICAAHDPVTIASDKLTIAANGSDTATITVTALLPTAAPITLLLTRPNGEVDPQAVTMASGLGTQQFNTQIPGVYTVTLQNPTNRTTDVITVVAQ